MSQASDLEIRAATAADHAHYSRLFLELSVDDPVPDLGRFVREIAPTTLIAERDGRIVGYAQYRILPDRGHLGHLVASSEARRTGIGRRLMEETIARLKAHGCTTVSLNVKPQNTPARTLYESFGLAERRRNRALRLAWSIVDALPGPVAGPLAPGQDAALEAAFGLAAGTLAQHREREGRSLFSSGDRGAAVFDAGFNGAHPFVASSVDDAWTLLRAIRPHATKDTILLALEGMHDLANELIAAGAIHRFDTVFMTAPI